MTTVGLNADFIKVKVIKMMLLGIILSVIFGFINTYIAKKLYYRNKEAYMWLTFIFIGILWILAILAAFNIWNYYWFLGYTEGNDFLWNWPFNTYGGGTINFDYTALSGYEILLILSYPFWYKFGATRFHQLFGRRPWQKGAIYLLTVPKRPKGLKKGEKAVQAPLLEFDKKESKGIDRKIDI